MAGFSNFGEEAMLDWLLTQGPFHVALFEDDPQDDNSGTECTGASYARQVVTFVRAASTISNDILVAFPESTGSWGTLTHFAIFDALVGGNQLWHGTLTASKTVEAGETLTFAIGELTATAE